MEFDKNKILTVVTADQARIGQKGWFSNHPNLLKSYMERQTPDTLKDLDMDMDSPFYDGYNYFNLFYPAPEPTYAERQAEWVKKHNLKVGDKVVVLRTAECREDGWCNDWVGSMNHMVGNSYTYNGAYDTGISLSCGFVWPYFVLEVVKEPTYRPYNNDELNDLVGEILTNKQSGRRKIVTGKPTASEGVNLDGSYINAKDLLASFYRNGNEPCGVKEVK